MGEAERIRKARVKLAEAIQEKQRREAQAVAKSPEDQFRDWEGSAFGFGYGTGERHTLAVLKGFLDCLGKSNPDGRSPNPHQNAYEYEVLEAALTPAVAWLMINALCRANVIEYGSSPRYGWLTTTGERLRAFVDARTVDQLVTICCAHGEDYVHCYPDACNCGPEGYEAGRTCNNPFWR